jgi:hypothetical protein
LDEYVRRVDNVIINQPEYRSWLNFDITLSINDSDVILYGELPITWADQQVEVITDTVNEKVENKIQTLKNSFNCIKSKFKY